MSLARDLAVGVRSAAMLTASLSEDLTVHQTAGDLAVRGIVQRVGAFDANLEGTESAGNTRVTVFRRLSLGKRDRLTVRGQRVAILDYSEAPVPGDVTVTTMRVDLA